jgi:hypothetical protein
LAILDADICNLFYSKFTLYNVNDYSEKAEWGNKWVLMRKKYVEWDQDALKRRLQTDPDNSLNFFYNSLWHKTITDLYWLDCYFFLGAYSSKVYKLYLDGKVGIDLLEKAVNFSLANHKEFIIGVKNSLDTIVGSYPINQYSIYLEKHKLYNECLDLMDTATLQGWGNDFESRKERVMRKKSKQK